MNSHPTVFKSLPLSNVQHFFSGVYLVSLPSFISQQFQTINLVIIQRHVRSITGNSIVQITIAFCLVLNRITARLAIISAIRRDCQEHATISSYHIQEYVNTSGFIAIFLNETTKRGKGYSPRLLACQSVPIRFSGLLLLWFGELIGNL